MPCRRHFFGRDYCEAIIACSAEAKKKIHGLEKHLTNLRIDKELGNKDAYKSLYVMGVTA